MSYFNSPTRSGYPTPPSSVGETVQGSGCGGDSIFARMASYVGIVPRGNMGNAPEEGCAVDVQNRLMWGDAGTQRPKEPQQLFPRSYATTPFMANGSIEDVPAQSTVIFGHSTANRKSIQTVSDKQFPVFEPLIQSRQDDIPANNYFVEPFLRGGMASRLIPKQRVELQ
jgi:hypothetical protein